MVPPTTLVCAFSEKRSKPPPGSGFWPIQAIARGAARESRPRPRPRFSVLDGSLIAPSKANLIGAPASRTFSAGALSAQGGREIAER